MRHAPHDAAASAALVFVFRSSAYIIWALGSSSVASSEEHFTCARWKLGVGTEFSIITADDGGWYVGQRNASAPFWHAMQAKTVRATWCTRTIRAPTATARARGIMRERSVITHTLHTLALEVV